MKFRSGARLASFCLLALLSLIVFAIVALMYIDPSQYREQIENIAQRKGIDLKLTGDIGWELYPNIQLRVRGASASHQSESMSFSADIEYFTFALRPWAAVRGELDFVGVEISGANIQLTAANQASEPAGLEQRLEGGALMLPQTAIEYFSLSDISIQNRDRQGEVTEIYVESLTAENARSDGEPFAIEGDVSISSAEGAPQHIQASGFLRIDSSNEVYAIDLEQFSAGAGEKELQIELGGYSRVRLDFGANRWSAEGSLADDATIGASGKFSGTLNPLSGRGSFEASVTNIAEMLAHYGQNGWAEGSAVKMLAIDSELELSDSLIKLDNLRLRLDENPARGSLEYPLKREGQIVVKLHFQELDLDQYLPKTDSSTGTSEDALIASEATDGDLSWLNELGNISLELSADQLTAFETELSDLQLDATLAKDLLRMQLEPTQLAGGYLSGNIEGQISGASADFRVISLEATDLDLAKLLADEEPASILEGTIDASFTGNLENLTAPVPLQRMQGNGQILLNDLVFTAKNIEKSLCESAELLGAASTAGTQWVSNTFLGDIDAAYLVTEGTMGFQGVDIHYGNMELIADGVVNLVDFNFDLNLLTEIKGATTSDTGCNVNKYAQGVPLPMQCSGTFEPESEVDVNCGLDAEAVQQLVVQQVGGQLIEGMLGELIENESGSAQTDQGSAEMSDESVEDPRKAELRNILEGLLKNIDN